MTQETGLTVRNGNVSASLLEQVVVGGDLANLKPEERVGYYRAVCDSLGLNPLSKPFAYIRLNGRLVLYAQRDATDQLRKLHGVSITRLERETLQGVYTVTAHATDKGGREDSSIGAVSIDGLKGEALANAYMKAETKAKRRVTLSLVGLGWLDETEVSTISDAPPVVVDTATGEIVLDGPTQPVPSELQAPSKPQLARLFAMAGKRGIADDDIKRYITEHFGLESTKLLTQPQYDQTITWIEQYAELGAAPADATLGR